MFSDFLDNLKRRRKGQHSKYLPFAFMELGISMLSSVLNSNTAIATNRNIMRTFVMIRKYVPQSDLKFDEIFYFRRPKTRRYKPTAIKNLKPLNLKSLNFKSLNLKSLNLKPLNLKSLNFKSLNLKS